MNKKKDDKISGLIVYNQDKTLVAINLESNEPITEANFWAYVYDLLEEYATNDLRFEDMGLLISEEALLMELDDEDPPPGTNFH